MAGAPLEGDPVPADGSLPGSARVRESGIDASFHAYVHVPFCKVRCGYCDFNTYISSELQDVSQAGFSSVLASEIEFSKRALENTGLSMPPISSVFFGGGTPTQLPASDLGSLLLKLDEVFGLAENVEVTTEANPDDLSENYLLQLAKSGFTRISLGMQSAVPKVLEVLDRTHNPSAVAPAIQMAKNAGLGTSVDIIYGSPGETIEDFKRTLDAVVSIDPSHVSAYSLIVEPGTKMHRKISRGELPAPDPDLQAEMYEYLDSQLKSAAYHWYELSNFAKDKKFESVHNRAYWSAKNWWGYGPGAHSHVNGTRWWNVKHPSAYAQRLSQNTSPGFAREELSKDSQNEEAIMLGLRLAEGIPIDLAASLNRNHARVVSELIADGLIDGSAAIGGRIVLTLRGRLLADRVVSSLVIE